MMKRLARRLLVVTSVALVAVLALCVLARHALLREAIHIGNVPGVRLALLLGVSPNVWTLSPNHHRCSTRPCRGARPSFAFSSTTGRK